MMLRWHLVIAAVALAMLLPGTYPASAFGALAIDSNRGPSYGFAYDEPNVAAARLQAATKCGVRCRAVVDFHNTCAAYAADQSRDNGPFGWAKGSTGQAAQTLAMRYCRQHGGKSCQVRVWACESFRTSDSRATARYIGSSDTAFVPPERPPSPPPATDTARSAVQRLTDLLNGATSGAFTSDRDAPPSANPPSSNPPSSSPPLFSNDGDSRPKPEQPPLFGDDRRPQTAARSNNLFDDPPAKDQPRTSNLFEDNAPPQNTPRSNNLFGDEPPRTTTATPPQKVTHVTPPQTVRPAPPPAPAPSATPPQKVVSVSPPPVAKPAPVPVASPKVVVPNNGVRRIALVVGNDRYEALPSLQKAANDARAIGNKLAALGFEVIRIENAPRRRMNQKLVEFAGKVGRGDTAFFFFAGHGVEIRGINYLLPTDTPAVRDDEEALIMAEGIPANGIVEQLQERGAKVTMLVLDACRDNPFKKSGTRGIGGTRGLAQMTAPEGVFVLYSAGVGQSALDRLSDNDPNPNSVFTRTLVNMLDRPGLTVQTMAKQTQAEVYRLARTVRHVQMPAYYDPILGQSALVPAKE